LAAIRYFHRAAGYDTPTGDEKVKAVLSGIRRTIGAAPVRKKAATSDIVLGMVGGKGRSLRELRDRAILLVARGWGELGSREGKLMTVTHREPRTPGRFSAALGWRRLANAIEVIYSTTSPNG
jgi:hypothetical protein